MHMMFQMMVTILTLALIRIMMMMIIIMIMMMTAMIRRMMMMSWPMVRMTRPMLYFIRQICFHFSISCGLIQEFFSPTNPLCLSKQVSSCEIISFDYTNIRAVVIIFKVDLL